MERIKYILLLILLINTKPIIAQNTSINESVFIHANATTFVTGEKLLYKIYSLKNTDKTPSTVSKVAYVELIDACGKNIFKNKLYLKNSSGEGDYFIPTTIKTGGYKLIGYTNWMLNSDASKIFQIDIKIINPYQISESNAVESKAVSEKTNQINSALTSSSVTEENASDKNFKIKVNKDVFSNREKVTLGIESSALSPEKGSYSLSVRKKDNLPTTTQLTASDFSKIPSEIENNVQNKNAIVLPELRGEMISGKVISKNSVNNSLQNIIVALSIPGKSFAYKAIKTNEAGRFIFNVDKPYYNNEIVIQIIGEQKENYTIELDKASEPDYSKLAFQSYFNLPGEIEETLLERSVASQIENAYYTDKTDSIIKPDYINPFYYPVAKQYILSDYTRFPSLKETITEVATELYYRQSGADYSLHVNDYSLHTQLPEKPLVIVDGFMLQNINELFNFNMANVYSISIITGQYYVGPQVFNGVISFVTLEGNFTSLQKDNYIFKPTVLRPSVKKSYYSPDYAAGNNLQRIPDYRYQLLWKPDVTLDQKEDDISFYTSDVKGSFEVVLEGFTEKGQPVYLSKTISVE
ncbi:hypothetical protein [Flavobacterium pectinovorum]|uniref:TonB-dependent Receptor Plug Domain n=1 Tax=Flavobacterium pectinovorum TaxID=29533 RepID=A0A502EQU7_9FLAO|nr:hypothetical protein [Flavobacterium pectinovorum]TPG39432.1 hypothetical protein EAH81_14405 [Flavobacterium pectinovorum]